MWCSTVHLSSAWPSQDPQGLRNACCAPSERKPYRVPQAWSAYLGSPDVFDGFGRLALRFLTISWASFLDVLAATRSMWLDVLLGAHSSTRLVRAPPHPPKTILYCLHLRNFESSSEMLLALEAEDTATRTAGGGQIQVSRLKGTCCSSPSLMKVRVGILSNEVRWRWRVSGEHRRLQKQFRSELKTKLQDQ